MPDYIPTPYDSDDQFPEAWRSLLLRTLMDLGDIILAAHVRRAEWTDSDASLVATMLEAELRSDCRADIDGHEHRAAVLRPLAAAWRAWQQADPTASPTSAAHQAREMAWRFRQETAALLRRAA